MRLGGWARRAFTRFTRNERVRAAIFPYLQRSPAAAMFVLRVARAIKGSAPDQPIPQAPVPDRVADMSEPARGILEDLQRHCAVAPDVGDPR